MYAYRFNVHVVGVHMVEAHVVQVDIVVEVEVETDLYLPANSRELVI